MYAIASDYGFAPNKVNEFDRKETRDIYDCRFTKRLNLGETSLEKNFLFSRLKYRLVVHMQFSGFSRLLMFLVNCLISTLIRKEC